MNKEQLQYALSLEHSGQLQRAAQEYCALAESSTDPSTQTSLLLSAKVCYEQLGDLAEAKKLLQRASALVPYGSEMAFFVEGETAELAASEGRHADALRQFDSLASQYRQYTEAEENRDYWERLQLRRAFVLTDLRRPKEALALLHKFLAMGREVRTVRYYLGVCHFQMGEDDYAEQEFKRVIEEAALDALQFRSEYYLGLLAGRRGDARIALNHLKTCADNVRTCDLPVSDVYEAVAAVYDLLKDSRQAERYRELAQSVRVKG